jgi:hypothetical protein
LKDETLKILVNDFCDCVLDNEKGPPPFLDLSAKEKEFFEKYKADLRKFNLNSYQTIMLLNIVDEYCQQVFADRVFKEPSASKKTEPYHTMPDHNAAEEYSDLLDEYCNENLKIPLPTNLKLIVEKIAIKSCEIQNNIIFTSSRRKRDIEHEVQTFNRKVELMQQDLDELKGISEGIKKDYKKTVKKFNESKAKFDGIKTQYDDMCAELNKTEKTMLERTITVLGIFSAIVLTFNAGVSFSSIVLETLITSSIYRAILITLVFGLILGNAITGLFAYLEFVRKKRDESETKINENSSKQPQSSNVKNKIKSKTQLVLIVLNSTIVALIIATLIFWWFGVVEIRNQKQFGECKTLETTICSETEEDSDNVISGKVNVNLHSEKTE